MSKNGQEAQRKTNPDLILNQERFPVKQDIDEVKKRIVTSPETLFQLSNIDDLDGFYSYCGEVAGGVDAEEWEQDMLKAFLFQYYGRDAANIMFKDAVDIGTYKIDYDKMVELGKVVVSRGQLSRILSLLPETIGAYTTKDIITQILAVSIRNKVRYAQQKKIDNYNRSAIAAGRCFVLSSEVVEHINGSRPDLKAFVIKVAVPCVISDKRPYVAIMDQHNILGVEFAKGEEEYVLLVDPTVAQMEPSDIDIEFSVVPSDDYKDYVQLRYGGFPFEGGGVSDNREREIDQEVLDAIKIL